MQLCRIIFIAIVGFTYFQASAQKVDLYDATFNNFMRIKDVKTCDLEGRKFANKFKAAAEAVVGKNKVKIIGASCVKDIAYPEQLNLKMSYTSPKKVAITDTRPLYGAYGEVDGPYLTEKKCIADLKRAGDQFNKATKLKYFAAFCSTGGRYFRGRLFAARFIAVGSSKVRKRVDTTYIYGGIKGNVKAFFKEIESELKRRKINYISYHITTDSFFYRLSVSYYEKKRFYLDNSSEVIFGKYNECLVEQKRLQKLFSNRKVRPLASLCDQTRGPAQGRLNILTFGRKMSGGDVLHVRKLATKFKTKADCDKKAAEIKPSKAVVGAICGGRAKSYQIYAFFTGS